MNYHIINVYRNLCSIRWLKLNLKRVSNFEPLIRIAKTEFSLGPIYLTLSWRTPLSYRIQPIDLRSKPMDWLLYDNGLRHERVKNTRFEFINWIYISNFLAKFTPFFSAMWKKRCFKWFNSWVKGYRFLLRWRSSWASSFVTNWIYVFFKLRW